MPCSPNTKTAYVEEGELSHLAECLKEAARSETLGCMEAMLTVEGYFLSLKVIKVVKVSIIPLYTKGLDFLLL